ncbi:hypothetical protein HAHE_28820 [Haloferula helveola]|uniref:HEAT repeat domain-containing protein n=1 Tax=Haloferula helveola TaxID=490095 RepID=A0ABM7RBK4_9BACT|nr:hypothetical protein HAHE_28820 [Haloferula helveola]
MTRRLMVGLGIGIGLVALFAWRGSQKGEREGETPESAEVLSETEEEAMNRIEEVFESLRSADGELSSRELLSDLKMELLLMPSDEASEAIVSFLKDDSRNVATGLRFGLGLDHQLDSAPTLRVALLDWLGKIDPEKAAELAVSILSTSGDPNEWAICLRNKALGDPSQESLDFVEKKALEMIRRSDWRTKPTISYLESFDVLVHTKSTAAVPVLAEMVSDRGKEGEAVAHAAFLTLDRLVQLAPEKSMKRLMEDLSVAESRPTMLAQVVARADLRDAAQRSCVEAYLLDPERSPAEIEAFAAIFPNANFMVSDNLVSETVIPAGAELEARERAALGVIDGWMAEERFEPVRSSLERIRERLETRVVD